MEQAELLDGFVGGHHGRTELEDISYSDNTGFPL